MKERPALKAMAYLEQSNAGSGVELWRSILRYKWLILICCLIGGGGGYLHFLRQPIVYKSTARILVVEGRRIDTFSSPESIGRTATSEDNIVTQMILLRSPMIAEKAVEKHHLESLSIFARGGDAVSGVLEGLYVALADPKSRVLDLGFTSSSAGDSQTVLKAVLDSYKDFLQDTDQQVSAELEGLIKDAKDTLMTDLEAKEEAYQAFREKAKLIFTKEGAMNVHKVRLAQIEQTRASLIISRSQTKAQLQALESALAAGGNREALMLLIDKVASADPKEGSRANLAHELFPLLLEEQMLLEDFGKDHPKIKAIRKRIEVTRNHLQLLGIDGPGGDENPPTAGAPPADFISVYLESLRADLQQIDQKQKELDDLFASEMASAKELSKDEVEDDVRRNEIARKSQVFDVVVKRLEEISLTKDYGKQRTKILSNPGQGSRVAAALSRMTGMGVTMGLFFGVAFAFLLELADKRFRSPEEIAEKLGVPVIGHTPFIIPQKSDGSGSVDSSVCVFHRSKSSVAEAYRGIRTALYFSTRGEGHKVIQVSSPNPGDGKSTLAANLAVVIAQSGKKTLLVESDFRRPRVHVLFGLDRGIGVTNLIAGESELDDAVQATGVEGLSVLACGRKPSNPSELLSSPRYAEMINVLREKFDYVIIDTPPLMAVTDPAVVASRVDGVILAIRINKRSQNDCFRAAEVLMSVGANMMGVVVNGVSGRDQYGYGNYGKYYGRGSGQGSGRYGGVYSTYGYDESRYSSYYADEDEPARRSNPKGSRSSPLPPSGTA